MEPRSNLPTHDVTNQPPGRGDGDLWACDPVLQDHAHGGDTPLLQRQAQALGTAQMAEAARQANRQSPELRLFDAGGRRLDEVRFHPAYHDFLHLGLGSGYASGPWTGGSHLTHAAMVYLHSQVEPGTCCPMTMTYAAVPALRGVGVLGDLWASKLSKPLYDPSIAPLDAKAGVTLGMAMTEKQGGSDVRANTTSAARTADGWRLTGHKWFCSAPMSDGFLTLAQAPGGLTCFLVPRWLEGGRNAIHILRLKDKLGNRSNASAEIEYHGALAESNGDEGDGIRTILQMVHHTRLDTATAPAGLMRAALGHAHHWVSHRTAFQKRLIDQPLMRSVLADLVLDWEGATALAFRVAGAFDDPTQAGFARIGVALAKFLNNKLAGRVISEAMEVMGGMGYVEDTPLPMLYREAPLNSIWEGSGNVICLDIRRSLARDPSCAEALEAALEEGRGRIKSYDLALSRYREAWPGSPSEAEARRFAAQTAQLLTAATLMQAGPHEIAESFCATRLSGSSSIAGSGPAIAPAPILARLGPEV
ncbi:acyl-CoA dehydrogenase family protein [Gymnodinialimonas hymeniacidonis]|uniref:acyl-CoA dehydrogenase family protein n=1 Tax=Gymnodinialimonas hymeniacidonis TaxID=3126508 RepID=UPI0034C66E68